MKNYIISFYNETDLRYECAIKAYNEISALAKALDHTDGKWIDIKGMKIEIGLG